LGAFAAGVLAGAAGAAGAQNAGVSAPGAAADAPIDCSAAAAAVSGAVCTVDVRVYVGWRVFHAQCATCHAQDAVGSTFAPDLTRRIREMDAREFFRALDDGYLGPHDVTPPRGANPDVARYYEELWSYLAARARGELPPGPLARAPNVSISAD
jgi:cytochrome c5